MRTVLFERPPPPYAPVVFEEWQQKMWDRINSWYGAIPAIEKLNSRDRIVIETFELTYHAALFYLYRPSTNNPTPSGPQWVAMTQAAINMIQLYRRFFLQQKLTIYWQAVENLSSAGAALMYGYATAPQVREYITSRSLESAIHMCSSVLWGMVERFPAFQGKRDAFDAAASIFLAGLSTGMPPSCRAEESLIPGDTYSIMSTKDWIAAENQAPSDSNTSQNQLSGENRAAEPPIAGAPAPGSPAERRLSQSASLETDGEPDLAAKSFFFGAVGF